jgi:hypothetical protein
LNRLSSPMLPSRVSLLADCCHTLIYTARVSQGCVVSRASEFADFFAQSVNHATVCTTLGEMLCAKEDIDVNTREALNTTKETSTSFWWGLSVLLRFRMFKDYQDPAVSGPNASFGTTDMLSTHAPVTVDVLEIYTTRYFQES